MLAVMVCLIRPWTSVQQYALRSMNEAEATTAPGDLPWHRIDR